MTSALTLRAGPAALRLIRERGLRAEDVDVLPGKGAPGNADVNRRERGDAGSDPYQTGLPDEIQQKLVSARDRLPSVTIAHNMKVQISQVCAELDVDGLRGDIVTNRAAKALAAFEGRTEVTVNDIQRIIALCLRHRLRKDPLESIDSGYKVEKIFCRVFGLPDPEANNSATNGVGQLSAR